MNKLDALRKKVIFQSSINSPHINFSDSIYIWDIKGKKILLSDLLINKSPTIVYKIAINSCETCIDMMMATIDSIGIRHKSINFIVIIPDTISRRLRIFKNKYNLRTAVYGI